MRELLFYSMLPILCILIFRNPLIGLIAYTGFNIIRPEMLFWGGMQGAIIFKVSIGVTIVSFLLQRESDPLKPAMCREVVLIFWIWLAIMVSLQFSTLPLHPRAYDLAAELFKLGIFGWLLLGLLDNETNIILYQKSVLVFATLLALWGVDQSFRGNERLEGLGGTAFSDSNGIAAVFVLFLPLAFNMAFSAESKAYRWWGRASSFLIILAIIFTKSRGGFLGLCVCTLMFALRVPQKKKIIVAGAVLFGLASLFVSSDYKSRLTTIASDDEERDMSSASRLVLWKAGLMVFRDNPLAGAGFLSFPYAKLPYRDAVQNVDDALREYSFSSYKVGHNTYVQVLAEGGLFLFIPYAWLLIGTFWENRKLRVPCGEMPRKPLVLLLNSIEAGIIGYCVCIFFIDDLTSIFLPIQILVSRAVRNECLKLLSVESPQTTAEAIPVNV